MKALIFDIETGPLPTEEIEALVPPFDEGDVALGNLKDPAKITEKIESARTKHIESFVDTAALRAMTGRVLAIGYAHWNGQKPSGNRHGYIVFDRSAGGPDTDDASLGVYGVRSEAELLGRFWAEVESHAGRRLLVGFNSNDFDLPFLWQRSLVNNVRVPMLRRGRYWSDYVVDLKHVWTSGSMGPTSKGGLDAIARYLGVGGKTGSGAHFHVDFCGSSAEGRRQAIEYLANDIDMTMRVADAMHQVVPLDAALHESAWFPPRWRRASGTEVNNESAAARMVNEIGDELPM